MSLGSVLRELIRQSGEGKRQRLPKQISVRHERDDKGIVHIGFQGRCPTGCKPVNAVTFSYVPIGKAYPTIESFSDQYEWLRKAENRPQTHCCICGVSVALTDGLLLELCMVMRRAFETGQLQDRADYDLFVCYTVEVN